MSGAQASAVPWFQASCNYSKDTGRKALNDKASSSDL
jgi:hypothetical protein